MSPTKLKQVYFAGGCFWGVEEYFSYLPGVYDTQVGYANGKTQKPTYEEVCRGNTGHAQAVRLVYDPEAVSLKTLADHFFRIIDPLSVDRQGSDVGHHYRSGIYYSDEEDLPELESAVSRVQATYKEPLAVELAPLAEYWPAEEYHQNYLKKNPNGYCHIKFNMVGYIPERQFKKAAGGQI